MERGMWIYSFKDCLQEIKTCNLTWVCAIIKNVGLAPQNREKISLCDNI